MQPQALAEFQSQLQPDPDHHFPAVDLQIFGSDPNRVPNMQGFVKSYYNQQQNVAHSHEILYYFKQSDLPVLTTLATAVCGVQPLVCVDTGANDLQPGVRALWDVVWAG